MLVDPGLKYIHYYYAGDISIIGEDEILLYKVISYIQHNDKYMNMCRIIFVCYSFRIITAKTQWWRKIRSAIISHFWHTSQAHQQIERREVCCDTNLFQNRSIFPNVVFSCQANGECQIHNYNRLYRFLAFIHHLWDTASFIASTAFSSMSS